MVGAMQKVTVISSDLILSELKIETLSVDEINNAKEVNDDGDDLFMCKVNVYKKILRRGPMPPIIIDNDNNIFDGQCRFQAQKELGAKYVLCMRTA